MLIDQVTVELIAGQGGKGAVAWHSVKLNRGPVGGAGGWGSTIFFEGASDVTLLMQFQSKPVIKAPKGNNGQGQYRDGHNAEDTVIKIPIGTVITNLDTDEVQEMKKVGERIQMAKAGQGGRGNWYFKSSVNQTPHEFEEGKMGETVRVRLDLKLIADIGLTGLPNAGKSSLLNALTSATAKVGNYAFTTLEANLGSYYGLILADIPGLIEGASDGKGLGIKFLKHIERTSTLFHLVACDSLDPMTDYKTVRNELTTYSKSFEEKEEYIILTKTDMVTAEELQKLVKQFEKLNRTVLAISLFDDSSLDMLKKLLNTIRDKKESLVVVEEKVEEVDVSGDW